MNFLILCYIVIHSHYNSPTFTLLQFICIQINFLYIALAEYSRARLKFCEQVADQATNCESVVFMDSQGITGI